MTLHVITGPPAAGKSTWVKERAKHGDITIDFDELAAVLSPVADTRAYPHQVLAVVKAARSAAISTALQCARNVDIYIVHAMPSPSLVRNYERRGAQIVTIDPGKDVVLERCRRERPASSLQIAEDWYADKEYVPFC